MTEIELYSTKLIEAIQDNNPVLLLRRIKNNASSAVSLAVANSILTEAAKFATNLAVTNKIITSANESKHIERMLSYMCLQRLSELHLSTFAYKNGFINENCIVLKQFDNECKTRLNNLSVYLKENALPLMRALNNATNRISKQHILRKLINVLDKVR